MITVDSVVAVLGVLIGYPAAVALVIDVLKWAGVVTDGTAPKWSTGFNLLGFVGIYVILGYFPTIDIAGIDAVLLNYVNVAAYVFTLVGQIVGTKGFHLLYKKTPVAKLYK